MVFLTFFKLYKWYEYLSHITYLSGFYFIYPIRPQVATDFLYRNEVWNKFVLCYYPANISHLFLKFLLLALNSMYIYAMNVLHIELIFKLCLCRIRLRWVLQKETGSSNFCKVSKGKFPFDLLGSLIFLLVFEITTICFFFGIYRLGLVTRMSDGKTRF